MELPTVILTGSLPMGYILCPLTVRGVTCDGRRLSLWSLSCSITFSPATETSAPESGRAVSRADPLGVERWALIVGAGSNVIPFTVKDVSEGVVDACTAFVEGSTVGWAGLGAAGLRDLHTFARCPTRLHV